MKNLLILVIAAATIQNVASIYCKKTATDWWTGYKSITYIYCSLGYKCCGTESTRYCCYDLDYSYSSTNVSYNWIGPIVGGVVGGIVFITVVSAIIRCICIQSNRSRGVVAQAPPPSQPNAFVVSHNHNQPNNSTYPPAYPPPYPPPYPVQPGQVD